MAQTGSCLCGKVKVSYTGEPAMTALCHCGDCKKMSGSTHSFNNVVPGEAFTSSGTPKEFAKVADSGATIKSFFCGDCGTTLWRESPSFGTSKVIKAGIMDDQNLQNASKPVAELFVPERAAWQPAMEGAAQKDAM